MIGPLPSPRHELFAQAVSSGMSASKSYALAYSRPRNGATRASAARLLTNANVKHRIAETSAGRRRAGESIATSSHSRSRRACPSCYLHRANARGCRNS